MVIIKLINGLSSLFKAYFTMLGQKTRDKNKLLNLFSFFLNFKNKKCCIKQIIKINLAQL